MSIESVREYLSKHAPDLAIIERPNSTSTVAEAAQAHGVARGQIAKTLALWLRDEVILLVLRGDAKIDPNGQTPPRPLPARPRARARRVSAHL